MAVRHPLPGWRAVVLFLLGIVPFALLVTVLADDTLRAMGTFGGVLLVYMGWSYYVVERNPSLGDIFTAPHLVVVLVATTVLVVWVGWVPFSAVTLVHLAALTLFFFYYWVITLLAVYHKQRDRSWAGDDDSYRSLSVLIPAYNESGYVGMTIRAVLEADYPAGKKEVIVVDDGSTDSTYEEAQAAATDIVTVVRKKNGGKHSALNYGLLFASGEHVVTIDADSFVHPEALKRVVEPLHADDDVGAVASEVKVMNPDRLVTACQQIEYVVGMNVYRRMFDLFGAVTIVPGCLGAYRRSVIEEVYAYDPDTLTEDFDATVKVLKSGYQVAVSDAVVYTEVPDSWRDLYRQRLRWYRGNAMTLFKHADALWDPSIGFVHRLAFPLRVAEIFFLPIASWIILGVIVARLLTGDVAQITALFVFFTSVVVLISLVAIQLEGEAWALALYSPLLVVGYKHFHDVLTLKSTLDVLLDRDMGWTSASRARQREERS